MHPDFLSEKLILCYWRLESTETITNAEPEAGPAGKAGKAWAIIAGHFFHVVKIPGFVAGKEPEWIEEFSPQKKVPHDGKIGATAQIYMEGIPIR